MSRSYSEAFLLELHRANPNRIGTKLAHACVNANLPAKYVAVAMGVTRMTIYSWFRGKPLRFKNELLAERLIECIEEDTAKEHLPAKNNFGAKAYLDLFMRRLAM